MAGRTLRAISRADLQARQDRVGVLQVKRQELNDIVTRGFAIPRHKQFVISRGADQRLPLPLLLRAGRQIQHHVQRHVNETSEILCAVPRNDSSSKSNQLLGLTSAYSRLFR